MFLPHTWVVSTGLQHKWVDGRPGRWKTAFSVPPWPILFTVFPLSLPVWVQSLRGMACDGMCPLWQSIPLSRILYTLTSALTTVLQWDFASRFFSTTLGRARSNVWEQNRKQAHLLPRGSGRWFLFLELHLHWIIWEDLRYFTIAPTHGKIYHSPCVYAPPLCTFLWFHYWKDFIAFVIPNSVGSQ